MSEDPTNDEEERPAKRFKHLSYKQSLKDVHLPSALEQSRFDEDIADNDSHFHQAIGHWRQLNLAPSFIKFANKADGLSASMPLLLHHHSQIVELWIAALDAGDSEALKPLLDLLQKLAHDLRTTLTPNFENLVSKLVPLLRRAIPSEALTSLLATFSALFKYIMIPSDDFNVIQEVWASFREALLKSSPEVRQATAEVWGVLVRKLKLPTRSELVTLLVSDLNGVEDFVPWVIVDACKSVAQSIHTAAPSIISQMLRCYIDTRAPTDELYHVIRRVLTALIHNVGTAEQFTPAATVILDMYKTSDPEKVTKLLPVFVTICSVRHGSRLSTSQLKEVAGTLSSISLTEENRSPLLQLSVSLLIAGDSSLWATVGREIIARSWETDIPFAIELSASLCELGWGGWKSFGLPPVLKHTHRALEITPTRMLRLLAWVVEEKKLATVDAVWKQRVEGWVEKRLLAANWHGSEDDVSHLRDILTLSPLLPNVNKMLDGILQQVVNTAESLEDFQRTPYNASFALGMCLKSFSNQAKSPKLNTPPFDLADMCQRWGWSETVTGALVSLTTSSPGYLRPAPLESVYASLKQSLLSHSQSLRLSVLRILSSSLVTKSPEEREVIKRCLQCENTSIDVQGSRERVLWIGRIPQIVPDGRSVASDIAVNWLVSQLKVNLRPLWAPTMKALSELSKRCDPVVWSAILEDLRRLSEGQSLELSPEWAKELPDGVEDVIQEEERTWQDPSAHKMRVTVASWTSDRVPRRKIAKVQISNDRFDPTSYHTQLLGTLGECSSLAEKHNRDLIPLFLSTIPDHDSPAKNDRRKLTLWLTLFSKFPNPKALYATGDLRSLYTTLLSHPDRTLQRLALKCILTYRSPHLTPHQDILTGLLDDTRWRDELTKLNLDEIDDKDRPEFVETFIRLLYGLMLEKRGNSKTGERRGAVIHSFAGCRDEELGLLVELMLGSLRRENPLDAEGQYTNEPVPEPFLEAQQVGYLNLLDVVLKNLGSRLLPFWPALLGGTLDILAHAQQRIETEKHDAEALEPEEELEEDSKVPTNTTRSLKAIRQLSLKRFAQFCKSPVEFDFSPFIRTVFRTAISSRLSVLAQENSQSPSALLELFYVWTAKPEQAIFLTTIDHRTLPNIYDCMVSANVKPTVISKVLDIVEALLAISSSDEEVSRLVLKPYIPKLLENLATAVERSKDVAAASNVLGHRQIFILSELAPHLSDAKQATILLALFSPLLKKPPKVVPETVKANMINIISNLFPLITDLQDPTSPSFHKTFMLLSQLMLSLRTRPARSALISANQKLVEADSSLSNLSGLIDDLNAYSTRRVDEPDFDRRISAFTRLNGDLGRTLSLTQWIPILYNMLHFIQDAEELALRTNSATVLRIFIDTVSKTSDSEWEGILVKNVYPGLKNGLRSKYELVRAEILAVIAHGVTVCRNIPAFHEMQILLADGDEEVNFFNNVHHIQIHRRIRALRRFGEWCGEGQLRSSTLADVFLPLIGNYIGATDTIDHHLVTEAINTTGSIAHCLAWGAYNNLIHQYLRLVKQKDSSERVYVRAIVAILDNFHFNMDEPVAAEEDGDENINVEEPDAAKRAKEMTRIADSVHSRLLPALLNHLERRDENEDTIRIPIAVGIINVAKHLPDPARTTQVTRLLTVLSQAFRSKSQETRDLTRDTLCRIAATLGPEFLPHIIRELRAALLRGPHLHVLAVVTHALLVHLTSPENSGRFKNFDDCVEDIAYVSAEVIFGESGKDTQPEGFKTKLREVRSSSSKGLDSFSILAKHITSGKISALLHPIRSIMQETETLKTLQLIDDVLKKIAGGINSNERISPADLLSLCQSFITQNAKFLQVVPAIKKNRSKRGRDSAIVQLKRTSHVDSNHYANNSFRFVAFGLDLFHTAHKRNRFDFQDPDIIRRLEPMVTVIGNTLYSQSAPVLILGMRCAAAVLQCPLKSAEKASLVVVNQIMEVIRATGSTESDVVQTGLRSLSAILRHHDEVQVKEKDLLFLLEFVAPDLEEPTRQGTVFALLRAIISRRFVVPEMYDLMDNVSEVMVTNQSPQVQEHCRGILLQFLLEYPHGKNRLKNQMTSLAKNLSYVYESGRSSVLELLNALVNKLEVGLVYEYSDLLFVALVMVIANDDSTRCREMAAELIKSLYLRLDESRKETLVSHLHTWISQATQQPLIRVSCLVYGFLLLIEDSTSFSDTLLEDVNSLLERSSEFEEMEEGDGEDETLGKDTWQTPYQALTVLTKLLAKNPELAQDHSRISWSHVVPLLLYPHAWVRAASCRLLGTMLATVPATAPRGNVPSEASESPRLFTREWMELVTQKLCMQLKSEYLGEDLSLHIVKNLFYFGRCFSHIPFPSTDGSGANDEGSDEAQQDPTEDKGGHPLRWLFSRLSFQARSAYIARRNKAFVSHDWSRQPSAILKWFAAMTTHLSAEVVETFLVHVLTPVYRITEDDSVRDPRMEELKLTAIELQDMVRSKVGGNKFAEVYNCIRQGVIDVQRERRVARTLQHTTNPEAAAKRKIQRNVAKKGSRKRKDAVFLERKGRVKRMREF